MLRKRGNVTLLRGFVTIDVTMQTPVAIGLCDVFTPIVIML